MQIKTYLINYSSHNPASKALTFQSSSSRDLHKVAGDPGANKQILTFQQKLQNCDNPLKKRKQESGGEPQENVWD